MVLPDCSAATRPKQLLIVHAGQFDTGRSAVLAQAAYDGVRDADSGVDAVLRPALQAGVPDLLAANGLLLITPEKFGYMAGSLKDFFDRTFYPTQGKLAGLPYALMVVAGNDGAGAVASVERIARGYPLKVIAPALVFKNALVGDDIQQARDMGAAMAAGISAGIF